MELPAPALRRAARLLRRDVHPHAARPRGPAEERDCDGTPPEDRAGNPRARADSLLALHGAVSLRRELGYYSRNAAQFGKAGDFYTSSDVHAVFGACWRGSSTRCGASWDLRNSITVKELGPGRGLFAQDVLDWSEKKFPEFFHALQYVLVEQFTGVAPANRRLSRHLQAGRRHVDHRAKQASPTCDAREDRRDSPTIVFANEFFDALPVEIVSSQGSLRIDAREGRFVETWVSAFAARTGIPGPLLHPSRSRRTGRGSAAVAQRYARRSCATIERGFFVAIDYGYTRDEQLAGRHRGTLKAIRQHSVSANPYEAPGEQDITADVNFTALAAACGEAGHAARRRLVTQSQFLMGIGEATNLRMPSKIAACRRNAPRSRCN